MTQHISPRPTRVMVALNLLSIYVIWGSTYLAIRIAEVTFKVFPFPSMRFLIAGAILYGWMRWRGAPRPTFAQWRSAAIIGILLLFVSHGTVVWSETRVSSGVAALVVAIVPLWMVIVNWARPGGVRPARAVLAGVFVGLIGVALLLIPIGSGARQVDLRLDPVAILALVGASLVWSAASILGRTAARPASPMTGASMQMICAGTAHAIAGFLTGQWQAIAWNALGGKAVLALAYLIVFGSIVGFSSYVWLLHNTSAANVSTYAYVNPVVALALGRLLGNETAGAQTLVAGGVIIVAVVIITSAQSLQARRAKEPDPIVKADENASQPGRGSPRLAVSLITPARDVRSDD